LNCIDLIFINPKMIELHGENIGQNVFHLICQKSDFSCMI